MASIYIYIILYNHHSFWTNQNHHYSLLPVLTGPSRSCSLEIGFAWKQAKISNWNGEVLKSLWKIRTTIEFLDHWGAFRIYWFLTKRNQVHARCEQRCRHLQHEPLQFRNSTQIIHLTNRLISQLFPRSEQVLNSTSALEILLEDRSTLKTQLSCVPGSKLLVLGMVIQPLIGNPYNGYINSYYWVDDHPLLYGNNGSLDPGTCLVFRNQRQETNEGTKTEKAAKTLRWVGSNHPNSPCLSE